MVEGKDGHMEMCEGLGGGSYVLGPALAIDRSPGLVCLREKFSSANFSP